MQVLRSFCNIVLDNKNKANKMDIQFPKFPLIYLYIEKQYNKCESYKDYIQFTQNCFSESETSINPIRGKAYFDTACVVYSKLTNTSWEFLNNHLEQWQNRKIKP